MGNGDGTFEEVDIADYGMLPVARASFQHHCLDMNVDDVLDLYVINDRFDVNVTTQDLLGLLSVYGSVCP